MRARSSPGPRPSLPIRALYGFGRRRTITDIRDIEHWNPRLRLLVRTSMLAGWAKIPSSGRG